MKLLGIISILFSANLYADIYPTYCSNYGPGVSYSYQSCINSNFSQFARELDAYVGHCYNYGDRVSYSFTSCVNNNFREIDRHLGTYSGFCTSYGDDLSYSFVSCVYRNFSEAARVINTSDTQSPLQNLQDSFFGESSPVEFLESVQTRLPHRFGNQSLW